MVTTKEICDYATATPHNTNASVLKSLIDQHDEDIRAEGGGSSYAGTLVYKGTKDTFDELPTEGNRVGDVWYVMSDSQEYIWLNLPTGQDWEKLGPSGTVTNHMTKVNLQQGSWENNKLKISNEIFKSGEQFLYFVSPADSTKEEYLRAEVTATSVDDLGMIFDCIKQPQTDVIVEIARLDMKEMIPGPGPDPKPEVIPVNRIIMNPTTLEMTEGETTQLKATVEPSNATNKALTWESDSASVTVQAGLVHAQKEGKAIVSAVSYNGKRASCTVNVTAAIKPIVPVSRVTVTPTQLKLKVGSKSQLQVEVMPKDATEKKLTWSSSTQNATVQNGLVTAVSEGVAEIKAESNNGKTGICTVTIEEDKPVPTTPYNYAKVRQQTIEVNGLERIIEAPMQVTSIIQDKQNYSLKCHVKITPKELAKTPEGNTAQGKVEIRPSVLIYGYPQTYPTTLSKKTFLDLTPVEFDLNSKVYGKKFDLLGSNPFLLQANVSNMSCTIETSDLQVILLDEFDNPVVDQVPMATKWSSTNSATITSSTFAIDTLVNRNAKIPLQVAAKVEQGKQYLVDFDAFYDIEQANAPNGKHGALKFWPKGLLGTDSSSSSLVESREISQSTQFHWQAILLCNKADPLGNDGTLLTVDDEKHKGTFKVTNLLVHEIVS